MPHIVGVALAKPPVVHWRPHDAKVAPWPAPLRASALQVPVPPLPRPVPPRPRSRERDLAQLQVRQRALHQELLLPEVRQQRVPKGLPAENLWVSQNDQAVLCPRQGDVQPPGVAQEPNSLVLVAPDTAQDDEVLLPALEAVHGCDLDTLVRHLSHGTAPLHVVDYPGPLALIRGNHANLIRGHPAPEESGHDPLNSGGLRPIQVRGPRCCELLLAELGPEHHRHRPARPREVPPLLVPELPVPGRDPVLQRALVPGVRGELGERGVHPVLDLEALRPNPERHEPLEEALAQPGLLRPLFHHYGAELALVANEDEVATALYHGDHELRLGGLG
mmetsp:Transcript_9688/g.34555  ORF Transcript_9688/g.34555 Transcript_9688/m.34555 type:complete len:333 (-) Transcript_9688:1814-2812(-)